jgi:hypothetical protein
VTIYLGGGAWAQSTNGMRAHDSVYLFNGIVNDDPWTGQSTMNTSLSADAGTLLSVDAIDEFKNTTTRRN